MEIEILKQMVDNHSSDKEIQDKILELTDKTLIKIYLTKVIKEYKRAKKGNEFFNN
jgi:hypothetical protein